VVSTTALQKPNRFIINNGTKNLEYPFALKNDRRIWRQTKIQIQPGRGELVKHWGDWHSGMGMSRDLSREAEHAPPFFEDGDANTVVPGYIYPRLALTTVSLSGSPSSVDRVTELGSYIYAFSTVGTDIRVHKIDPSDDSVVYERTFSGWTAPAGQPVEFGGATWPYLYVPGAGDIFKELTTVVDDLTAAFLYNGAAYTDNTANANVDGGTAFTLLGDNSDDIFYWGADTDFDGIYIDIVTAANTALTLDWEYWNGSAWTDIVGPETDGTSGFTTDGWVTWAATSCGSRHRLPPPPGPRQTGHRLAMFGQMAPPRARRGTWQRQGNYSGAWATAPQHLATT